MEKHYEDDEIEIDLQELLFELLNNWVMIVISTVLVGLIAFCISKFIMIPQYQSTAQLYVLTKSTSITSLTDLQTSTNLTNDYKVVVTGRPVLETVIDNLRLTEETYATLSDRISVNNPSNSRILEITVTDQDPYMAKKIADEVADVGAAFISEKMDQDPPSVIQYGYVSKSAVSPNTMMNTLLGAILGALVAIVIIIVTCLLNDSVMTAEDIERKLGMNVLGTLPLEEMEYDGARKRKKQKTIRSVDTVAKKSK